MNNEDTAEQAKARLRSGLVNAILIELLLAAGVLAGMLTVAYWGHL